MKARARHPGQRGRQPATQQSLDCDTLHPKLQNGEKRVVEISRSNGFGTELGFGNPAPPRNRGCVRFLPPWTGTLVRLSANPPLERVLVPRVLGRGSVERLARLELVMDRVGDDPSFFFGRHVPQLLCPGGGGDAQPEAMGPDGGGVRRRLRSEAAWHTGL